MKDPDIISYDEAMTDTDNKEEWKRQWHKRFNSWRIMALGNKYQSLMQRQRSYL
jgi:hypothetical protein